VTVIIANDPAIIRHDLGRSLEREEGLKLVGQAAHSHETVELTYRLKPNLVLTGISMSDLTQSQRRDRFI